MQSEWRFFLSHWGLVGSKGIYDIGNVPFFTSNTSTLYGPGIRQGVVEIVDQRFISLMRPR